MLNVFLIIIGGGLGSGLRYLLTVSVNRCSVALGFPWGILCCNAVGSLLIGFIAGLLVTRQLASSGWAVFWTIGVCGGFTTFSSFSLDTVRLIEMGLLSTAISNILLSVLFCCLMTVAGLALGRII